MGVLLARGAKGGVRHGGKDKRGPKRGPRVGMRAGGRQEVSSVGEIGPSTRQPGLEQGWHKHQTRSRSTSRRCGALGRMNVIE